MAPARTKSIIPSFVDEPLAFDAESINRSINPFDTPKKLQD
jgi:hypothetical protein